MDQPDQAKLKTALEILKYLAIGVTSISGIVGTMNETKDKGTHALTPWGRRIISLIVVSGIVGITTQSVETYLKHVADTKDDVRRGLEEQKIQDTLATAKEVSKKLGEQSDALGKTVVGVERTAKDVRSVQSAQVDELLGVYRLAHPLGKLRVEISATYLVNEFTMEWSGAVGRDSNWIARVREAAARRPVYLLDPSDILNPDPETEKREHRLFREPVFDVELSKTPTQSKGDGGRLVDHGSDLLFRTTEPGTRLWLRLNGPDGEIQQYVGSSGESARGAATEKVIDTLNIKSWIDLYGAELIVHLPQTAPSSSRITYCHLHFQDDSAPLGGNSATVKFDDRDRRGNPANEMFTNITYVKNLSENELGPKPRFRDHP